MRNLVLVLIILFISLPIQADEQPKPVDPSRLEGTALKLPVGTIELPGPNYRWLSMDESTYVALPDDGGPFLTLVYVPISAKANADPLKAQIERQMLPELVERPQEANAKVTKSNKPLFGSVFRFEFRDTAEKTEGIGYVALAQQKTLFLMAMGESPEPLLERARASFKPDPKIQFKAPTSTKSFAQMTSPIPANRLKDGILQTTAGYLTRPNDQWEWSQLKSKGQTIYFCTPGEGTAEVIMAFTSSGSQEIPAETLIRAMLSQVAPTAEVKVDFSPPDVTLPGGTKRVDYSMLLQGSVLMKGMGYVTKTDKYSLFVWSLGQENLETEVKAVAGSFKEDFQDPLGMMGAVLLVLGLVLIAICGLVNMLAKRPIVNGGMIAFVLTVLVGIFPLLIAAKSGNPEFMGRAFGSLLLPLLVFAFSWSRFRKKRREYLSASSQS